VVFDRLCPDAGRVHFETRSGRLTVERSGDRLRMDFPAQPPLPCLPPAGLTTALGAAPVETLFNVDLVVVLDDAATVRSLAPDLGALAAIDARGVAVTAEGDEPDVDFVSRFFGPRVGVPEDPVTGSAHCKLVPYWAARLGRTTLHARQVSARGGELWCELLGDRVAMSGEVRSYLEGTIAVPAVR
jgi:predicted PhzF superfamily epimerase YddE/YHI9